MTSHQVTAHMPSNLSATHQVIKQLLCNWVVFPLVYTICIAMIPSFAFELSIWHLCCSTCTHVLLINSIIVSLWILAELVQSHVDIAAAISLTAHNGESWTGARDH